MLDSSLNGLDSQNKAIFYSRAKDIVLEFVQTHLVGLPDFKNFAQRVAAECAAEAKKYQ